MVDRSKQIRGRMSGKASDERSDDGPGTAVPVALVTGGARKLGASMARHLASQGYRVVVNYRSSHEQAKSLIAKIREQKGEGVSIRADVTRPSDVTRMMRKVEGLYGGLDVLINNVGDYMEKPLCSVSYEEWDAIIRSNLYSAFLCTKEALPLLRAGGHGRILMIGYAPAGKIAANPRCAVYHLAKTGVLSYTKALAVEEAGHGITVNMVSPGTIFNSVKKPSKNPGDYIPAGRFCRYGDILGVLDYLLSPKASYVTGGHFVVSGGYAV